MKIAVIGSRTLTVRDLEIYSERYDRNHFGRCKWN